MTIMRGEPLVAKLAAVAKYVVFPGAMAAAVIYSPPPYASYSKEDYQKLYESLSTFGYGPSKKKQIHETESQKPNEVGN